MATQELGAVDGLRSSPQQPEEVGVFTEVRTVAYDHTVKKRYSFISQLYGPVPQLWNQIGVQIPHLLFFGCSLAMCLRLNMIHVQIR